MSRVEFFLVLQAADIVTTLIGIQRFGATEQSPAIAWLMVAFGTLPALLLVKLLGILIAAFALWRRRARVIMWANVVFSGIVGWNVAQLVRALGSAI